jgi:TIR domain
MQLFISHSRKDREWVEHVRKRIEVAGFHAYLAEYDLAGIGHELSTKIRDAIAESAAVVVVLTENAASSPIVRDEIGCARGLGVLVVPLVTPAVAQSPAALGMLNGREYIPFDIDDPQEGLIKLTDWVNHFARTKQEELHRAQLAAQRSQLQGQDEAIAHLQAQNDAAMVLLVFVAAVALALWIATAPGG